MFDYKEYDNNIDFVYLDGPPVDNEYTYNHDIVSMMEEEIFPKTIIFDVRYITVIKTIDYLKSKGILDNYKIILSNSFPFKELNGIKYFVSSDTRHSILEKIK